MHTLPWITIIGPRVRRFVDDFHEWRSHEWKSSANRITSDPKIVIHGNECIMLFLTRYVMSWTHNSFINHHRSLIRNCRKGRSFLTSHCDVTIVDMRRHANARYKYCDIILGYCSCTRKLAQKRYSLMNNNREYRFLIIRYSRPSV